IEIWSEAGERITEFRTDGDTDPGRAASRQAPRQGSNKQESPRSPPERSVSFDPAVTRALIVSQADSVAELGGDQGNKLWSRSIDAAARFAVLSPDGASLLFRNGATVEIWSIADQRIVALKHDADVGFAEFSPDGSRIVTAAGDKAVRLWTRQGEDVAVMRHDVAVRSVSLSASGDRILTVGADNAVRSWDSHGPPRARSP